MPFLDQGDRLVSSTNALGALFAPAAAYADRCAGLLALRISGEPRGYVLLFRREIVKTIVWAGEPTKKVVAGPDGMRLSPRRSFAAWSEDVRGRSARWTLSELRAAEAVRTMLVEVTLEASDQAHVARTGDGRRQEIVIAELNHRVRNMPLTQFDLADTLGLSVVHVNRTLQLLRQRGPFVWKGKVVTILDRPGLLKLAEFDPRYLRFQPDVTGAPARAA